MRVSVRSQTLRPEMRFVPAWFRRLYENTMFFYFVRYSLRERLCEGRNVTSLQPLDTFDKQYLSKAHTSCITNFIKINKPGENLVSISRRSREKKNGKTHPCFRTFRRGV